MVLILTFELDLVNSLSTMYYVLSTENEEMKMTKVCVPGTSGKEGRHKHITI